MKIGFLGAGEMGGAIIKGLIDFGGYRAGDILAGVHTEKSAQNLYSRYGIDASTDNAHVVSKADVLVIAVKPAVVPEVLQQIAQELTSPKPVLSVALGSTTQMLEAALPGFPVVRVMPNTPIALGKGMSLLARGRYVTDEQMQTARDLFGCAGRVEELPENLFDAATAVSGSGPAFIYYVIAALAKGGMDLGLPEKTANLLAAQMTAGAASMALLSGQSPAALQKSVTTPGGCTAAGVAVLEETRADQIFEKVVQATVAKAQEFAK